NSASTIEAINATNIDAKNVTSSGTILAQNGALTFGTQGLSVNKVDNQGVLEGKGIEINATELNNSTVNGKIFSTDNVDLNIKGNVTNIDGALVHANTDVTLDADGNLTNTLATIEALNSTKVEAQNVTSSGTILAQEGNLTIDTANVDNQGALAGNGIIVNATELNNSTVNGKVFSTYNVDLNIKGNVTNTDGALVHANTDVTLDAEGKLTNTDSTIEAINATNIDAQNVTNSGIILAQNGALTFGTQGQSVKKVDNQGVLAGKGIEINATELNNSTVNGKIFSTDAVDLTITGGVTNTDGALVHADTDVTLNAQSDLTNTGATIEAVGATTITAQNLTSTGTVLAQQGSLTIDTANVDNRGTLAGNGITLTAAQLTNGTVNGKLYSTGDLVATIDGAVNNTDGALIHAEKDLTLTSTNNDITNTGSRIEAIETATFNAKNVTNTGTLLAQNDALTVSTSKVDNQGTVAGKGIVMTANELSNHTAGGQIYSTDTVEVTIEGAVNNTDGALIHAEKALALTSHSGDITNTGSTIESVTSATLTSQNLTNSGTILAQGDTLTIRTQQLDNQGLLGGRNIDIEARLLNNKINTSQIYANNNASITTMESITNNNGALIHAGNELVLTASGDLTNSNATIESGGSISLGAQTLTNTAGSQVLAQNGQLTITANRLDNQGSLSGNGLVASAQLITNNASTSSIASSSDLALTSRDSFSNLNGAKVKANGTLTINTNGDLVNTGSVLESVNNLTLNSRHLSNASTGVISAQNGTLSINNTGTLTNQGGIAGNQVAVNAASIVNKGSNALILGKSHLDLRSRGNLTNQDGGVLYSLGSGYLKANGTLTNSSATIETNNDLVIKANILNNKKRQFSVSQQVLSQEDIFFTALLPDGNGESFDRRYTETVTMSSISVDSPQAYVLSGGNISIEGVINNLYSTISAVGNLNFVAGQLNNVSYQGAKTTELKGTEIGFSSWHDLDSGAFPYEIYRKDINEVYSEVVALAPAIFTAGGSIRGKAGSVSNVGNVDDVVASSVETQSLKTTESSEDNFSASEASVADTIADSSGVNATDSNSLVITAEGSDTAGLSDQEVNHSVVANSDVKVTDSNNLGVIAENTEATGLSDQEVNHSVVANSDVKVTDSNDLGVIAEGTETTGLSDQGVNHPVTASSEITVLDLDTPQVAAQDADGIAAISSTLEGANTEAAPVVTNDGVKAVVLSDVDLEEVDARRDEIFENVVDDLSNSALFTLANTPDPSYVIVTSPLLTNYETFISSDYLLNKLTSDSVGRDGKTAVRLGDGFLEQRLVRDQILAFTGFQTIPDSISIEDTYTTLMNNAVDSYEDLQLTAGVALSAEQIAQLRQPIVWMVNETVDTPNGPQQALVPKVYFSAASGLELRQDGALIAASSIDIDVEGEINNTGSMLAKVDLSLKGNNISNGGTLSSAGGASLTATQDIINTHTIKAAGNLSLVAGGSISSETLSEPSQGGLVDNISNTMIAGHTASIRGDNVSLSAGNNVRLIGSEVKATGDLALTAANDVSIEALAINKSQPSGYGYRRSSTASTTHQVSALSGNNIQLSAGNTVTSEAAQIKAQDNLAISANTIDLLAVQDTTSSNARRASSQSTTHQVSSLSGNNIQLSAGNTLTSEGGQINASGNLALSANNIDLLAVTDSEDSYSFVGGGGNSTEKRDHNETLTGTTLNAGGALTLVSQQDIFSQGSTLSGGDGIGLAAGGDVILASAVANNSSFEEVKTKKKRSFGRTKRSTKTTTSSSSINQGTDLTSGGDIQIASGVDILLAGSTAQADGDITLQAAGDIQLLSTVDQTSKRYKEQKKGTFKVKAKDQGSIKQV
ncbi:hemagglutinin repeat-containing protein, partial [Marinomonas transparens]